mmetsp:Transcript_5226/g.11338  ORF Transcript_5226/g.11338 Transcript_5226/m.11338 type:complete len:228 (+) Transcript_5226:174-857(+)
MLTAHALRPPCLFPLCCGSLLLSVLLISALSNSTSLTDSTSDSDVTETLVFRSFEKETMLEVESTATLIVSAAGGEGVSSSSATCLLTKGSSSVDIPNALIAFFIFCTAATFADSATGSSVINAKFATSAREYEESLAPSSLPISLAMSPFRSSPSFSASSPRHRAASESSLRFCIGDCHIRFALYSNSSSFCCCSSPWTLSFSFNVPDPPLVPSCFSKARTRSRSI